MNSGNTLIIDAIWVSNKPFPTMQNPNSIEGRPFYDYYLGEARYVGWLDLILLKSIIQKSNITHIILRNLDTLGKIANIIGEVKICTSYIYHNFGIRKLNLPEKELIHCKPCYHTVQFGGWDYTNDSTEIPFRAQCFMHYLLRHTGVNSITCMTNKIKLTISFSEKGSVIYDTENLS